MDDRELRQLVECDANDDDPDGVGVDDGTAKTAHRSQRGGSSAGRLAGLDVQAPTRVRTLSVDGVSRDDSPRA